MKPNFDTTIYRNNLILQAKNAVHNFEDYISGEEYDYNPQQDKLRVKLRLGLGPDFSERSRIVKLLSKQSDKNRLFKLNIMKDGFVTVSVEMTYKKDDVTPASQDGPVRHRKEKILREGLRKFLESDKTPEDLFDLTVLSEHIYRMGDGILFGQARAIIHDEMGSVAYCECILPRYGTFKDEKGSNICNHCYCTSKVERADIPKDVWIQRKLEKKRKEEQDKINKQKKEWEAGSASTHFQRYAANNKVEDFEQ